MAVAWLDIQNVAKIAFYDASAVTYYSRVLSAPFDLFNDNAAVGDWIGFQCPTPWKDLIIEVTAPVSAVGLTVIWEYASAQNGSWLTLSVIDGTQVFTRAGVNRIVFDPPDRFRDYNVSPFTGWTPVIRCRITGLTSITDGGAAAATPTCGKNRITVDGYSAVSPCRLSGVYAADLAGTRLLAPELPCTTGMTISRIYPAEMGAQRLIFTLAGTTAGAGDTLDLVGIGPEGEAITESIDVSAGNGVYTSARSYSSLTSFNCTGWADGTVKVEQGRWGNVWRLGYIGDRYNNPRLYMIDRAQFYTLTTAYFKLLNEVLIVNRSDHDRQGAIYLLRNLDFDQSAVIQDNRVADEPANTEDLGAITIGDSASAAKSIAIDDCAIMGLKKQPLGSYFMYLWDYPTLSTISESFVGNPGGIWYIAPGQGYFPSFIRCVINFALLWFQSQTDYVYDFGDSYLTGELYLVSASGSQIRNLNCLSVNHQYQGSQSYYLQNVVAGSWPTSISGAGSNINRQYGFNLKITDNAGNPISGAFVRIQDAAGANVYYQTVAAYAQNMIQTYIDVVSASQFSVGDILRFGKGVFTGGGTSKTISSIVIGGGAGGSDRINVIGTLGVGLSNQDPVQNTGRYLISDANGNVYQNYLIYNIIGNSAPPTQKTPHTITITKTGYATRIIIYTMDRKREEIEALGANLGQVELKWEESTAGNLAGYNIYRKPQGGSYTKLNGAPQTETSYTDTPASGTWIYKIHSVDIKGNESQTSAEITVVVP